MPTQSNSPAKTCRLGSAAARKTCEACRQTYGRDPNVIAVGTGFKFTAGRLLLEQECLHFYVRRKVKRPAPRKRLPRFVYARRANGTVDRCRKLGTDVIELKNLRFAARSGVQLDVLGECGTLTLLFRNKVARRPCAFLLTCAHVAGDLTRTPPVDPRITLTGDTRAGPFATTLVNATAERGSVAFDIALAQVAQTQPALPDCEVLGAPAPLSGFLPSEEIRPGLQLDCAFPVSNILAARVVSSRVALPLVLDGRVYQVNNLFLIDRAPQRGDSGGLLYAERQAAGILVGLSDGWGLIQPLGEAFAYLQSLSPIPIQCFATRKPKKGKPCRSSSHSASLPSAAACSPAARRSSPARRTSRKRRTASASIRPKST